MEQLKEEIHYLCLSYPEGIPLLKMPLIYRQTYKKQLDLGPLGFASLEGLLEKMLDRITLQLDEKGLMVKPARSDLSSGLLHEASAMPLPSCPAPRSQVLEKLKEQLCCLLQLYPCGIPQDKVCVFYRRVFKQSLKLKTYGFVSLREMVAQLTDIWVVVPTDNGPLLKATATAAAKNVDAEPCASQTVQPPAEDATEDCSIEALGELIQMLCEQHPQGYPVNKIRETFFHKYKKTLAVGKFGFRTLQSLLKSMSDIVDVVPGPDGDVVNRKTTSKKSEVKRSRDVSCIGACSTDSPSLPVLTSPAKSKDELRKTLCQEIVFMLQGSPEGIELSKVCRTYKKLYQRKLVWKDYGMKGVKDLLLVLGDVVQVEGRDETSMHAKHSTLRLADSFVPLLEPQPRLSSKRHSAVNKMEKAHRDVLELLKLHPEGIPLKQLAVAYSQSYKRNLTVSSFGFSSLSEFIDSLKDELSVEGDVVFYGLYHKPSHGTAVPTAPRPLMPPETTTPGARLPLQFLDGKAKPAASVVNEPSSQRSSVLASLASASPRPQEKKLTEEQLYKDVTEVVKIYPEAAFSLVQLQNAYFLHFKTPLPLQLYMSLYDKLSRANVAATVAAGSQVPAKTPEASGLLPDCPSALGAKLTKREQKKLQQEALKKDWTAPVFKEAYNSQVREVHNSNMQAIEVLDDDKVGRSRRNISVEEVDSLAEDYIRAIAAEGELVTIEKVEARICRHLRIQSLQSVRINRRQISTLTELCRTLREINIFIEATEAVRTVCTLYELGQCIAALKNKRHFEELNLGPLCKIPLIHKMFKVVSSTKDEDIHEIETVDILKSLRVFMKQCGPSRGKVDLAEFMKYLADQYNCESPWDLGIRIQSIALSIATLRKAVNSEHASMDKARTTIQREIEEEVDSRMRKIKKSLMEPAQGNVPYSSAGSKELRKKYAFLTAAEAVLEVFKNADGVFSARMTKHVQDFLVRVSGDRLATALFQLAICCGSLEVPHDLVAKEKTRKPAEDKDKKECKNTVQPPSEAAVRQYFQDCLSNTSGILTLPFMCKLEKKIAEHFKFKEFACLEHGTFLEFLVKQSQILQDVGGGALALSNQESRRCVFRPNQQDVYEFITQCGTEDQDRLPVIESALRNHYKVKDSRELGYGPLSTLVGFVQRQKQLIDSRHSNQASLVRYEAPLFARDTRSCLAETSDTVGLLGPVGKDAALACLLNAPLLEDLSEWSQWELVFEPQHGGLKDFIERNCGKKITQVGRECITVIGDLVALEVKPGVLLRVTTSTSDKLFAEAAMALDPIGTAGHLVSLVVADGILHAPIALLANHIESSLAAAVAQEGFSLNEEAAALIKTAKFLLDCLIRIPTRICKSLMQQVFLQPFSKVLGQAKSKNVLLQSAKLDNRYTSRLHQIGLLLGLTEWVKDFQTKLSPPKLAFVPSKISKLRSADSVSMSSRSSAVGLSSEDEEILAGSGPESESESEDESSLLSSDVEEEKFELALEENRKPPSESESQDLSSEGVEEEQAEIVNEESEELSKTLAEERVNQCKAVIDDIRKNEFGIGVDLSEEGRNLMKVHQERLGRSLDRLSTELYSKDTHFVLELIQNADDNIYPSNGDVLPALVFVVERDCISIVNNECGFEEKNIRAICDVGRSTKGKHKYGYIGQKGIGFKSVFKVTDCPEIHSNCFHICFDKNSGPMGYILPHWLEKERFLNVNMDDLKLNSWTTKIILPLRTESYQTRNLFHDVHPSLLLFLHRLRSITIVDESENRLISMTRKDLSDSILEVHHTDGMERWLVVKQSLSAKKIKDNVESTELALAFKLTDADTYHGMVLQPEKQPVFAFLPLRSFGFRFIIQADFDIPSSREDVDRDSPWNQWLRAEIPQLFLHAMNIFSEHPEFTGLQGLCQFLQFIPLPDEILDFFNPVAGKIIQLLKGRPCLPTKEDKDGNVEFKLPSQIAVSQDMLIQEVIGPELLERHLNLSYLNPAVQSCLPASLIAALGVHRLRGSDITAVTCAMAKEILSHNVTLDDEGLRKVAKLLVCNFRALDQEYGETDALLQVLREIPIIPLADGRTVALNLEGVFFPLSDTQNLQTGMEAIYKDLNTVNPRLLKCLDPLGNSQVRELLKKMEVHEMEPEKVIREHIYPILKNGGWKVKPKDIVISYLVFIKQHSQNQDYSKLNAAVPVHTNKGFVCPRECKVQFAKEYGNIDLPTTLPGVDWVILDTCYLKADMDVNGWREFFIVLGVQDLLIFKKEKRSMSQKELASSPWALDSEIWPRTADGLYIVEDYECEEFHTLITVDHLPENTKLGQRRELLSMLDRNWVTGDKYSQYQKAQVLDSQGRKLRDTQSSFAFYLTSLPWLPAFKTAQGNMEKRTVEYLCPCKVYLYSNDIYRLLGIHVSYVDMKPSDFSSSVGMKYSISVAEVITHLKSWCTKQSDSSPDEIEGADFTTTVEHVYNVYAYLYENCNRQQLKILFEETPAVFIDYERKDEWCSGRFYFMKEVCWSDPTGMFLRYREPIRHPDSGVQAPRVLAPFYNQWKDMKELFLKCLNVEPNPSMKQYVDLLELICETWSLPTQELLQDVSVIYAKLAEKCKIPGEQDNEYHINTVYGTSLKEMLADKKVFPTKDNCWVTLARRPLIPDNKILEKVFKPYSKVCLLNLPSADLKLAPQAKTGYNQGKQILKEKHMTFIEKDRALFLEILGVKKLSQCVTTEAQTENYRPCPTMQCLVRKVVPYIQKFLYHHEDYGYIYNDLKESNIAALTKGLSFGQVGKLYILYRLNLPEEEPLIEQEDVICLLKDKKELYIQKDHISSKLDICREIVKLFSPEDKCGKELERFLQGLMSCLDDEAALKRFLSKEDIEELPSTEEKWEVPEPIEIKPEPRVVRLGEQQADRSLSLNEDENNGATEEGEKTLACWPPKSSFHGATSNYTGPAVERVMKMWPPPAEPAPSDNDPTPSFKTHSASDNLPERREHGHSNLQAEKPSGNATPHSQDHSNPSGGQCPVDTQPKDTNSQSRPNPERPTENTADTNPTSSDILHTNAQPHIPAGLPTIFQGSASMQRPLYPLDSPIWEKALPPQAVLEDLTINSTISMPQTVVFSEDCRDTMAIGEWGESLVYAFLTGWKENGSPDGPKEIVWYNRNGESGQPCDFKVTFGTGDNGSSEVFIEVKATVKSERNFIHLSANELDLALKERDRYHIYRVYNAGDSQNVRLCRIRNLAQHLHAKELELFLFV
ncbi:uncharacterized protein LOC136750017 isoform X2 [Amia ocellicauda]|uniref:uncharacterized protein LOC136750017 isoform X2 n=1 Tax=Amia ocellicauda TaxID=2972642 RepID=UPI0034638A9E